MRQQVSRSRYARTTDDGVREVSLSFDRSDDIAVARGAAGLVRDEIAVRQLAPPLSLAAEVVERSVTV